MLLFLPNGGQGDHMIRSLDDLKALCEERATAFKSEVYALPDIEWSKWDRMHTNALHRAVDACQALALRDGLVDAYGQDAVQSVMSGAFRRARTEMGEF
jgi:hypothetical protein